MSGPKPLNSVKPSNDLRIGTNNFAMQGMGPTPLGGDFHQSIKVSPQGEVLHTHMTAQIPGDQKKQF